MLTPQDSVLTALPDILAYPLHTRLRHRLPEFAQYTSCPTIQQVLDASLRPSHVWRVATRGVGAGSVAELQAVLRDLLARQLAWEVAGWSELCF